MFRSGILSAIIDASGILRTLIAPALAGPGSASAREYRKYCLRDIYPAVRVAIFSDGATRQGQGKPSIQH